jgi:hypothetical protein
VNTNGTASGDLVYSYGNSIIRLGITAVSPKIGISTGDDGNGWTHVVTTASPGIPGDSGSAFLTADGKALGVLSTLTLAPLTGSNNVSDLSHMLTYMHQHSSFSGVSLVTGGAFSSPL